MKKVQIAILIPVVSLLFYTGGLAQVLAGTDALGRTLIQNDSAGNPKNDRFVAMFYFLNHDEGTARDYWDLSEIIPAHPEVLEDYDNPWWGTPVYYEGGPVGAYYWGKPLYGYYRADDYWVSLRSIQLLTDAGVDLLVIDATNYSVFADRADILMKAMDSVRLQGKNPPKIVFYTNTASGERIQQAYENFYKPGAPYYHPDCWFYLDGKPLIIGLTAEVKDKYFENFFTYRESQWPTEKYKTNGWPWIEFQRPQKIHFNSKGEKEIINVSVAQHPNPKAGMGGSAFYGNKDNWGRSFRKMKPGNPETDIVYGYNLQEQWDFAIQQDPKFIYVTGWNEWTAGRWTSKDGNPEHSWFCDQASPEYSRDIEPTYTAGLKDNYYMQLACNIRKYKGIEANLPAEGHFTIKDFKDWKKINRVYKDYIKDTAPRNWNGAESRPAKVYTNYTGRNDFDTMKIIADKNNVFFYSQTVSAITPDSGDNWMNLYINSDRNYFTGWEGFDYKISGGNILNEFIDGTWKRSKKVLHVVSGNKMMIIIPRDYISPVSEKLNLEFKWSDNIQDEYDPLDWYINGDAAPGGRFTWIFNEK